MGALITTLILITIGFTVGKARERSHFRDLERREERVKGLVRTNLKTIPENWHPVRGAYVDGQAVIASDYFKTFASSLRKLFGGELRSFETLMNRARREASLRMLEQAAAGGAQAVWNIRIETSTIARGQGKKGIATAEVHVYGTALWLE